MDAPHKRNLIAVSTALMIYFIGEGDIKSASTLLGTITLGKPSVLLWGAWGFFVYSLWQFWLRTPDSRGSYRKMWRDTLRHDPQFQALAVKRLNEKGIPGNPQTNLEEWIRASAGSPDMGVTFAWGLPRCRFLVRRHSSWESVQGVTAKRVTDGTERVEIIVKQEGYSLELDRLVWKHIVKTTITNTRFSDNVLPYVFAAGAVIALMLSKFV